MSGSGYILGFDIGANTIGWAAIRRGQESEIIGMGVRVFPEGVDRDTKGLEKSKNAQRREARSARRNRWRWRRRRDRLVNVLRHAGILPRDERALKALMEEDPYELRARGLDERLSLEQFGRVLLHINKRRGFKSNRKSSKAKEDGVVIRGASELQRQIEQSGCRTLGEYLARLKREGEVVRGRYTFRSMYEQEFDMLWAKQAQWWPEVLTEDLRRTVRDEVVFFQRPLKPTEELIGYCGLEPEEKRCPRADWYATRFRILQDVNNLRIRCVDGTERPLEDEERAEVLGELRNRKELKFDRMRRLLGLLETEEFNLEQEGKVRGLKGDVFSAAMRSRKIFGPNVWDRMSEQEKVQLNEWVVELEDEELEQRLRQEYHLTDEQIKEVLKLELPRGYMAFSRKAIMNLLPAMEQGKTTSDAIAEVYPDRSGMRDVELVERLGPPPDVRNPIVNRALVELRRVVNAIVREYGRPELIKLEMARDVKGSRRERMELHERNLENERRNTEARKRLRELGINNPSREDVIKYKLWLECGKMCPYTGETISQAALFGEHPEFQIEHILPYSRSLDDSYMNKTLCHVDENRRKRDKTPFEAYGEDPKRYEEILQRVRRLPWPKRMKFLVRELVLEDHIQRELNDTRYICREAVGYLWQICRNVQGTRGRVTNELRHQWGLDGIFRELGTERGSDHRRHAVDAAVVAVTTNEHLGRLAQSKYSSEVENFREPWAGFREQVKEKVQQINVSYRVCRKISGQLHEETAYGPTGQYDKRGQEYFVYRKRLEDLTVSMVDKIIDPVVRELVKGRLEEHGITGGGGKIPKAVWREPLYMKCNKPGVKVPIKKVRIRDVKNYVIILKDDRGRPYRAVEPGKNHHIEILEYKDEKGRTRRDGVVVTMFEAVRRSRAGEPVIQRDHGKDKQFVCSLGINEMFMLEMENGSHALHRVQKIDQNKRVILRPHWYGGKVSDQDRPPRIQRKSPNTLRGYKVTVDPLGRIWRAND